MNILLTGARGLIGSALSPVLVAEGCHVTPLLRQASRIEGGGVFWDPAKRVIDLQRAGSPDAVVHLAGESIGQRWTRDAKARIRDSRVEGTHLLCETISRLPRPPRVLVCASAVGFYGDRGDQWLDEHSAPGAGFLAETCRDWELAAAPAVAGGIRAVHLRLGIVLARGAGALARMLPVFRFGLGGRLGSGRQYWSWVTLEDVVRAIRFVLENEAVKGPANVVSPSAVTNAEFTRALGAALGRPACLPVPAFAVRLLFGEMGREALLASARVRPARLAAAGFQFRFVGLPDALTGLVRP